MEKISVIVPCYNVEKIVGRCIESIINQTIGIENMEIILVDDASTDNTLDILMEYEKKYPDSIMVIKLDINSKQGTARNIGLQYASSNYIGFVDSDDYIEPNMYEVLYNGLIKYDCDFSNCGYERVYGNTGMSMQTDADSENTYEKVREIKSIEDRKKFIVSTIDGGVWSKLFKKDFIVNNDIKFLENIFYEDNYWIFLIKLYTKKVYLCNYKLYKYCFYPNGSTITKKDSLTHLDRLKVELIKIQFSKDNGYFDIYHDEIEYEFLKLFYFNSLHIFATRFSQLPKGIMGFISDKIKEIFPQYEKNKYIIEQGEKNLLKCINMNLNDDEWNIIIEEYRNYFKQ